MLLQGRFAYLLGGAPPPGLSSDQVLDLIIQLLPVGAARMYGLRRRAGDPYNFYAAVADSLKTFWYDAIAVLRQEINPATTGYKLGEWEAALGLSQTPIALGGNTTLRRLQIVSRLREQGAFTVANIQAILGPLLGYADPSQLKIIEANRGALTTAHTYSPWPSGVVIASGTAASTTVWVADDGSVSDGGVLLSFTVLCNSPELVSVTLTNPDGKIGSYNVGTRGFFSNATSQAYTWPAGTLPAAGFTAYQATLRAAGYFDGMVITGKWTVSISAGAQAGGGNVQVNPITLFVEGGGVRDTAGNSGLGEQMHDWVVQYDPALGSAPNFAAVVAAIARISPADSNPVLCRGTTDGHVTAKCGSTLVGPFVCNTI
jgi:hypothetical protein